MTTTTEENAVTEKTLELCSAIVAQPDFGAIRQRIDAFMADDKSRAQYESLMTKGQALNDKQQRALPLSGEEISDFEKDREALLGNPVARLDIALNQSGRHGRRSPCKPGVTQCGDNGAVILEDGGMQPARVLRHMPIEHFKQRSGMGGGLHLR